MFRLIYDDGEFLLLLLAAVITPVSLTIRSLRSTIERTVPKLLPVHTILYHYNNSYMVYVFFYFEAWESKLRALQSYKSLKRFLLSPPSSLESRFQNQQSMQNVKQTHVESM